MSMPSISLAGYVALFQFGGGLLGCIMCMPSGSGNRLPEPWIDDPTKVFRYINRTAMFLMCNMLSLLLTVGLIEGLLGLLLDQPLKRMFALSPDWMDALLLLLMPLPLSWPFYVGFAKFHRASHSFRSRYRFKWHR